MLSRIGKTCVVVAWLCATAFGQTSYPMLMGLKPVAIQVGTTAECEVQSRYSMEGAQQIFISGTGVSAEIIPAEVAALKPGEKPKDLVKLKLRITVEPNAELGPREFRLATPRGASTLGQLVVVRDPVIVEQAKNNAREEAQAVTLPATLCGTIEKAEDFDFWKFAATTGQSAVFHVWSQRLEDKIHDLQTHVDPILVLRDANGSVLALSDNHFHGDPCLAFTFPADGDYLLEVRDVRYQGNAYWEYCVEAHSRPFVTQVFPLAVAAGSQSAVTPTGWNLAAAAQATITLPSNVEGDLTLPLTFSEQTTSPVPLYATALPILSEPLDPATTNDTAESATNITIPSVVNGRMEHDADLDVYAFEAKQGDLITLEVLARRYASELDSYVRILNAKGQVLKEEDDMRRGRWSSSDTCIEGWKVPADGRYFVEVRDVHLRGGEGFGYALKVTRSEPLFELALDTDKTNLFPGTHAVLFARATRKHGFTGEIALEVDGLPDGVTATCGRILADKATDGAIVFATKSEVAPIMSRITVRGRAVHPQPNDAPPLELSATAVPYQEIYMPGGGRGHFVSSDHVLCIGAPCDIRAFTLSETDIRLKPGESKTVKVTLERAPENKANITLDLAYQHLAQKFANTLPEGVTIDTGRSKTLLAGGVSEGQITVTAAKTAPPVEKQLCSVMAHFAINFVMKATYSSPPLFISVDGKE